MTSAQRVTNGLRHSVYGIMEETLGNMRKSLQYLRSKETFNSRRLEILASIKDYLKNLARFPEDEFCMAELLRWKELQGRIAAISDINKHQELNEFLSPVLATSLQEVTTRRKTLREALGLK